MNRDRTVISQIAYGSFYAAVIIEVLMVIIDKSAYINPIEGRLFQLTFVLFFVKVCLTKYSRKEYFVIFLFCLLGAVSYFVTDRNEIIRFVMFIAACKDIDMEQCLKRVFLLTLAGCVVIMLLSVTGIYGTMSLTQEYGRGETETRYVLGMGHPNALQCMVWALTTLWLYLYGKSLKWYHYLSVLMVNLAFFMLTDSKTGFLVTALTIMAFYAVRGKQANVGTKLFSLAALGITIFSIGISVLIAENAYRVYNHVWHNDNTSYTMFFVKLNESFNGRVRILVENNGFEGTLATWRLFSGPENNYYFDMGWIRLFYWYGIIPACVFIAVLLAVMVYCYKKRQYLSLMLMMSFALYSVIEAHAVSVYIARNYTLFLLGAYWHQLLEQKKGIDADGSINNHYADI